VSGPDPTLLAEEDRRWAELHELVDSLPEDRAGVPGYFQEGWSAKDLVGHIGGWLAEGGVMLERIHGGTYRAGEIDVDAENARMLEAMRDLPFREIRAQASSARSRMLAAWGALDGGSADADWWIRKAGPDHYAEHLPRLREWVDQLGREPA
jgi:hypothetical protein